MSEQGHVIEEEAYNNGNLRAQILSDSVGSEGEGIDNEQVSAKFFFEKEPLPLQNIHNREVNRRSRQSPGRRNYQTFGRSGEREREKERPVHRGDCWVDMDPENKENYHGTSNFGQFSSSKEQQMAAYAKYTNPKIASKANHSESVETVKIVPGIREEIDEKRPAHSNPFNRRERDNLRLMDVQPIELNNRNQPSTGNRNFEDRRGNIHLSTLETLENSPATKEVSFSKSRQSHHQNKAEENKIDKNTPTRPVNKEFTGRMSGLSSKALETSHNRGRTLEGIGNMNTSILHSPIYVESITELHKTEIEGLKTRHRLDMDRLESQVNEQCKEYSRELKEARAEICRCHEEIGQLDTRVGMNLQRI